MKTFQKRRNESRSYADKRIGKVRQRRAHKAVTRRLLRQAQG